MIAAQGMPGAGGDVTALSASGCGRSFDLVTILEVIELSPSRGLLPFARRALAPGGLL